MITAETYQEIVCKIDNANQSRLSMLQRLSNLRTSLSTSGLTAKNLSKLNNETYNVYIKFANDTYFYQNTIYLINKHVDENYSSLDDFLLDNNIFHTTYTAELSLNSGFVITANQVVVSCTPENLGDNWNNFTYSDWDNFSYNDWDNFVYG